MRLIDLAKVLVGWLPGSLAQISVVANALFGAISGSAVASARKNGWCHAVTAATPGGLQHAHLCGSQRGLVPVWPADSAVGRADCLFADLGAHRSTCCLLRAGDSGILMAGSVMVWLAIIAWRGELPTDVRRYSMNAAHIFWRALPALAMIAIIRRHCGWHLHCHRGRWCGRALHPGAGPLYRSLTLKTLVGSVINASVGTAVVMLMVGVSMTMSWLLASTGSVQMLGEAIIGVSSNPYVLLLLLNILLLVLGTFLDITPGLLIFTPIFLPVAMKLGISPVHFGIIMTFYLCIRRHRHAARGQHAVRGVPCVQCATGPADQTPAAHVRLHDCCAGPGDLHPRAVVVAAAGALGQDRLTCR